MKKILTIIALCSYMSMGLFAQKNSDNQPVNTTPKQKSNYTFGDFFDALDLPTV